MGVGNMYNLIHHYERFHDNNTVAVFHSICDSVEIPNEINEIENSESCAAELPVNIDISNLAFDFCSEIMTKSNITYASALQHVEKCCRDIATG